MCLSLGVMIGLGSDLPWLGDPCMERWDQERLIRPILHGGEVRPNHEPLAVQLVALQALFLEDCLALGAVAQKSQRNLILLQDRHAVIADTGGEERLWRGGGWPDRCFPTA